MRADSLGLRLAESGSTFQETAGVDLMGTVTFYPLAEGRWFVRAFAITPAVSYRYGRVDDLKLGGILQSEQWRHDVLAATVSLTFK